MNGRFDCMTFAILTVSDRCFAKEAEDKTGPQLQKCIQDIFSGKIVNVNWAGLVPDDTSMIQEKVKYCCDILGVNVLLTNGGTGLAPRDVTPEAILGLLDRQVPSLATVILMEGLKSTPFAALSRGLVGVRGKTIIVTLPGSSKGAEQGLQAIAPVLLHAVDVVLDSKAEVISIHKENTSTILKSKVSVNTDDATRMRTSIYPMMPMADLEDILMSKIRALSTELLHSEDVESRILAENVVALQDVPQEPTSMKDGFAIADEPSGLDSFIVQIVGESTPGRKFTGSVGVGQAVRVSTGSAVPQGTKYVIPVEETTHASSIEGVSYVIIKADPENPRKEGCDIRSVGSDTRKGEVVLNKDILMTPSELGVLASIGQSQVLVVRKPTVGILSSGDELQEPWVPLLQDGVRDSNKAMLKSLFSLWGHKIVDLGIARDQPEDILAALMKGFEKADVVISTGGMSMGERDLLKDVLVEDLNAVIHFGRLAMKPGKPTGFASLSYQGKKRYWFGLPGNPASAFVTAHLVVLPALRILSGWSSSIFLQQLHAQLEEDITPDKERVEYQRGVLTWKTPTPVVKSTGQSCQRSSSIKGCAGANCLLEIPAGDAILPARTNVKVYLLKI